MMSSGNIVRYAVLMTLVKGMLTYSVVIPREPTLIIDAYNFLDKK